VIKIVESFFYEITNSSFLTNLLEIIYTFGAWLFLIFLVIFIIKRTYKLTKEKLMLKKLAKSGIKDIDRMDGLQFEVYLKALLKEIGYKSEVTTGSHDFGADLIMKKDGKKIVIQAKRYGFKNKVSLDAVQQIYAAKPYYNANECCVFTNSFYTKSALKLAKACDVKLYDRFQLIEFINKINPSTSANEVTNNIDPLPRKCPACSGELIKRTSQSGNNFMGCSNFPNCKHTEPIAK